MSVTRKLVLYPNGDQKADGKDHVSLYLAIQETASLPKGWEVNVELKLFLFDHLKNKYLVVQGIFIDSSLKC